MSHSASESLKVSHGVLYFNTLSLSVWECLVLSQNVSKSLTVSQNALQRLGFFHNVSLGLIWSHSVSKGLTVSQRVSQGLTVYLWIIRVLQCLKYSYIVSRVLTVPRTVLLSHSASQYPRVSQSVSMCLTACYIVSQYVIVSHSDLQYLTWSQRIS